MNLQKTTDLIEKHEGLRLFAYRDTKGFWTLGIGFNTQRAGAKQALAKHGLDYDAIWNACQTKTFVDAHGVTRTVDNVITEAQSRDLVVDDIQACVTTLKKNVKGFDTMPDDAQAVLVDLIYNIGSSFLGWHHTIGFFEAGDWKSAAHELSISKPWCTQVPHRCADDVAILNAI